MRRILNFCYVCVVFGAAVLAAIYIMAACIGWRVRDWWRGE